MKVTLRVDLIWTDIEDFIEHIREDLKVGKRDLLGHYRTAWILYDEQKPPKLAEVFRGGEVLDPMPTWWIKTQRPGNARFSWWVLYDEGASDERRVQTYWYLGVWRFRQDRLALTLWESDPERGQAARLREWLTVRWGVDGVIDRGTDSAPPLPDLPAFDVLTDREREIAGLLAENKSDAQIAAALNISPETVKQHRKSIAAKWGVSQHVKPLRVEARRRLRGE